MNQCMPWLVVIKDDAGQFLIFDKRFKEPYGKERFSSEVWALKALETLKNYLLAMAAP